MTAVLLALLGCRGAPHDDSGPTGTGLPTDTVETDTVETAEPLECDAIPLPPYEQTKLAGFTATEDFAFTDDGWVVAVDENSNLVKQDIDGNMMVIRPGIGVAAGLRVLPGGDVVLANVGHGSLERITPEGSLTTVASGFAQKVPRGRHIDA